MRRAVCRLDDVSVRTRDGFAVRMGHGAHVDLDAIVGTHPNGESLTLADALGRHVGGFAVEQPVMPSPVLDVEDDGDTEGF